MLEHRDRRLTEDIVCVKYPQIVSDLVIVKLLPVFSVICAPVTYMVTPLSVVLLHLTYSHIQVDELFLQIFPLVLSILVYCKFNKLFLSPLISYSNMTF